MIRLILALAALLAAAQLVVGGPAAAQTTRGLRIEMAPTGLVELPFNRQAPVTVAIATDKPSLPIGATVQICFEAGAAGYASLYDVGTDGVVQRVFPNALSGGDPLSRQVRAGDHVCAGRNGDPFRFRVTGPAGFEELYLVWTRTPDAQPQKASYGNPAELGTDLQRLTTLPADQWATAKTSFDITDGSAPPVVPPPAGHGRPQPAPQAPAPAAAAPPAPAAPAPPPAAAAPPSAPKIFILAMGSNVKPLTKSNQDAHMFADTVARLFDVPKANIRVYDDVRRRQFEEGLVWLQQVTGPNDFAIFYYSGHGAQVRDTTGTSPDGRDSAFVPYEFDDETTATADDFVTNQQFVHWVNQIRSPKVISVIDACHSGGLYRGLDVTTIGAKSKFYVPPANIMAPLPPAPATRALAPSREQAKGIMLAAAKREQSALELKDGSLFTLAMVESLVKANDGTLYNAFEVVAGEVDNLTKGKQSPVAVGDRRVADLVTFGP